MAICDYDCFNCKYADCINDGPPKSEYWRDYYRRNREAVCAKQREYYYRNQDTVRAYQRKYRAENREKVRAQQRAHYAKKKAAEAAMLSI